MKMNGAKERTAYWLRVVANHMMSRTRRKLRTLGVTPSEWGFLSSVSDATDGIQAHELAAMMGTTRGFISKLVDRLAKRRLLVTLVLEQDRRRQAISLTPAGRQLLRQLATQADQLDRDYFGHLTARQQVELRAMLRNIAVRIMPSDRIADKQQPIDQ